MSAMVVQFLHPGREHAPTGKLMEWNRGPHRRKFVRNHGVCRRRGEQYAGDLAFWAEWEPQSRVESIEGPTPAGPRYLHEPFYSTPADVQGLQNTDPCVFGGFRYTICQQHFRGQPSGLQYLDPGSVILFGSSLGAAFVLDTVFVVAGQGIFHHAGNFRQVLRDRVPESYFDITLDPWYSDPYERCCLYQGATEDTPVNGTFSFFPALPWSARTKGFARPSIRIPNVISPRLTQGRKCTLVTESEAATIWREVIRQVEAKGLWLGVQSDMPVKVP
jgi:hypothetical protein